MQYKSGYPMIYTDAFSQIAKPWQSPSEDYGPIYYHYSIIKVAFRTSLSCGALQCVLFLLYTLQSYT